jgi:hypothetical protein
MFSTSLFFDGCRQLHYSAAPNQALRSATWPIKRQLPDPISHPHLGRSLPQVMLAVLYPMDGALAAVWILPCYYLWIKSPTSPPDLGKKILCFPSCLLFPSLVPVAFSLFSQSCSRCFLPVSSLSCSAPFILCAVMGSTDLGWSFVLVPSWFVSLDKKAGWLIAFLFSPVLCACLFRCFYRSRFFSLGCQAGLRLHRGVVS